MINKTNDTVNNVSVDSEVKNVVPETDATKKADLTLAKKEEEAYEIKELREANRKIFKMKDGSEKAVFYASDVHVFDDKTHSFENDNSKFKKVRGKKQLCCKKNSFTAKFNTDENEDEIFSIEDANHSVTVFANENNSAEGTKKLRFHKHRSKAVESDILIFSDEENGTAFEYSVVTNGIKENIVVKKKSDNYCYSFLLKCVNVYPIVSSENKKIIFVDNVNEEEVFFIPEPFMFDANGVISKKVEYELIADGENYKLTITADKRFMDAESRAFPVTIDPQISTHQSGVINTYGMVNSRLVSEEIHKLGVIYNDSTPEIKDMFVKINYPSLPKNTRIKKVELVLTQKDVVDSTFELLPNCKIKMYEIGGIVSENSTSADPYNAPVLDYDNVDAYAETTVKYSFDITAQAEAAYFGDSISSQFVFTLSNYNNATESYYLNIYGTARNTGYSPTLAITYESNYAINASNTLHTHSLGRFAEGSVELKSRALTFKSQDFSWSGNRMPVTIEHLYSSVLSDKQYTSNTDIMLHVADFSAMKLGLGFRINWMQSIIGTSLTIGNVTSDGYIHTDDYGNETYYRPSEKTANCPDGNGCYNLYVDTSGSDYYYDPFKRTLDTGSETHFFDSKGRLIKVSDKYENSILIVYNNDKIVKITDGAGRNFIFSYNANNFLTKITAPDNSTVEYTYNGNNLASIQYPDGSLNCISYTNDMPSEVLLYNSSYLQVAKTVYEYMGDRVEKVKEYGYEDTAFQLGNVYTFSYLVSGKKACVTTTEPLDEGETETSVSKHYYLIDYDGNIIDEYVNNGENNLSVADEGDKGYVSNVNNLLKQHSFETHSAWSPLSVNSQCTTTYETNESFAKHGRSYAKIVSTDINYVDGGIFQEIENLAPGDYTMSVYCKITESFVGNNNPGAFIRIMKAGNVLAESEHFTVADEEFVRIIIPFTLETTQSIYADIVVNGKGTAYFNAPQLENTSSANPYNLIENGSFEFDSSVWSLPVGASFSTENQFSMSRALCIEGALDKTIKVSQIVPIKKSQSFRESFTLSGWAKGTPFPYKDRCKINTDDDNEREINHFRLSATIVYNNGESKPFEAKFSHSTNHWQSASVSFEKEKFEEIRYLLVTCEYSHNVGTAYFDDIQLVRESFETGLTADDFSTSSSSGGGGTSEEETSFTEAYDQYGNALTETTFTEGKVGAIYRSFGYNADDPTLTGNNAGNDLIRETDARGKSKSYTVDSITSRNKETTERNGNKTAYEYDSTGRLTKVINKNIDFQEVANVSYRYDNFDNMTEIIRGDGLKYIMEYDAFHNLKSIGINGKSEKLISYTYKPGSERLKQMTFANGDTMKATYNSLGQMVSEKWFKNNSLYKHYKYTYDLQKNIVQTLDITEEIVYNYEYDDGNLVRATESNATLNGELIVGKVLTLEIRYVYTSGKLTKKRVMFANGEERVFTFEEHNGNTNILNTTIGGREIFARKVVDHFGRTVSETVDVVTDALDREFEYLNGSATQEHIDNDKLVYNTDNTVTQPTTQLISKITLSNGRTIEYQYDDEERISKVIDSVDGTREYSYDVLGQLVTEKHNNVVINHMTYDSYGNILTKNGKTYTYGNSVWKDLLTAYDGQTISYDAQGNPTKYLGHNLTWEKGRQLKSFDSNTYKYNADGIRISKTVNGCVYNYLLEGTKIIRQTWCDSILEPIYDCEDNVCGIIYNTEPFYFRKNLQGDIIEITDKNAVTVAKYQYDAWGVCTVVSDTSGCGISTVNPFRYRGYYFDDEIGMYYLQSRYYDPSLGRFVNSDAPDIVDAGADFSPVALNKFCYCLNSPVLNKDEQGMLAALVAQMIKNFFFGMVGGMVGLYLANVTLNLFKGKKDFCAKNDTWGTYIAEGVKSGAFAIFGSKLVYKIVAVVGASVLKQIIDVFFVKKPFSLWTLLTDILVGIGFVCVLHFAPTLIKKLPKSEKKNSSKWMEKIKNLIKKIVDNLVKKLKGVISKLMDFFKNVFVKRFSISYAKKIASELKKIFI